MMNCRFSGLVTSLSVTNDVAVYNRDMIYRVVVLCMLVHFENLYILRITLKNLIASNQSHCHKVVIS